MKLNESDESLRDRVWLLMKPNAEFRGEIEAYLLNVVDTMALRYLHRKSQTTDYFENIFNP